MKTPTGIPITTGREPSRKERFHLIGIGGAGMSALARWLVREKVQVSGSDLYDSPTLHDLDAVGVEVRVGHDAANLGEATWIVLSDAIHPDNPEVIEAQKRGLPLWRRSQLLGWLLRNHRVIAVTGTHGKTTTTALIARILEEAGFDPLAVLGGDLNTSSGRMGEYEGVEVGEYGSVEEDKKPEAPSPKPEIWQSNMRFGAGEWAVVEACEAYESFLDIEPEVAVITNIEADHLDYHGSYERLLESFARFCARIKPGGCLIACGDDRGVQQLLNLIQSQGILDRDFYLYGFDEGKNLRAVIQSQTSAGTTFQVIESASPRPCVPASLSLPIPGTHNVLNALAAIAVADRLGISFEVQSRALANFCGVKRRLEVIGDVNRITLVDDYAHHPTEITATLRALRQRYPGRRLVAIFQPHLYTRTRDQLPGFIESLSEADEVIITDIYPAREEPIPGVSAALIAEGLLERGHPAVRYLPVKEQIATQLLPALRAGDVVVTIGAGNVDQVAHDLLKRLERHSQTGRLRVAVILGGDSTEREVSLISGRRVIEALDPEHFEVIPIDSAYLIGNEGQPGLLDLVRLQPGVAFPALHGRHGEDGTIQGLLELAGIPYVGSGVLASALAMNKGAAKMVLRAAGLAVPNGFVVEGITSQTIARVQAELSLPLVVKPNEGGSTIGVSRVYHWDELPRALAKALTYDHAALVEEMIEGIEISAPVLGNRDPQVLPLVEIVPKGGFYDFEAKYRPGATEEIVPARLPEDVTQRAQEAALTAHRALGCRGMSRVDMIVREGQPYLLEINTIPGLTPTSLLPRCAEAVGISFKQLIERLIELALESWRIERNGKSGKG